jgi:hypothetical protein
MFFYCDFSRGSHFMPKHKKMRTSLFGFILFLFPALLSAQTSVSLIRGRPNLVDLGEYGDTSLYRLLCAACEIRWKRINGTAIPAGFVLLNPTTKSPSINLVVQDRKTKQTVKNFTYQVTNRAGMIAVLENMPVGVASTLQAIRIVARYPADSGLTDTGRVASWSMSIPGAKGQAGAGFTGEGEELGPEASQAICNAPPGSTISFIATIVDPDGISRKVAGAVKRE